MAEQSNVRRMAEFILAAQANKASRFLEERLRDGRITSRSTTCVGGVFHVCLVGPLFEACGESRDGEEDALAQAAQVFANWEYESAARRGGDAVDLRSRCF
jgi:hypothetical protein